MLLPDGHLMIWRSHRGMLSVMIEALRQGLPEMAEKYRKLAQDYRELQRLETELQKYEREGDK